MILADEKSERNIWRKYTKAEIAQRSLEKNRAVALLRLRALLDEAAHIPIKRRPTKPTASSQRKRVESKVQRGQVKALRKRVVE